MEAKQIAPTLTSFGTVWAPFVSELAAETAAFEIIFPNPVLSYYMRTRSVIEFVLLHLLSLSSP